jgi:hypothetical protein
MSNFDLKVLWALDVNTAAAEKALYSRAAAAGLARAGGDSSAQKQDALVCR